LKTQDSSSVYRVVESRCMSRNFLVATYKTIKFRRFDTVDADRYCTQLGAVS
jgi:hypothetical protein